MSEHEGSERTEEQVVEEARALREVAAKLEAHVGQMVSREVQAVAVPREKYKAGLLAVLFIALVFAFVLVAWNRVTLQQAQERARVDMTAQVVTCFLRPGDATLEQAKECARRNGGQVYSQRQAESREAVRRFQDLQKWAVEQGWTPPTTTTLPR